MGRRNGMRSHGNGYKGSYPEFTNVQMMMHPDGSVEVRIGIHDQAAVRF